MTRRRILVAMSGGVDSSVAAALLVEQGYEVAGVTLHLWGKEVCVSSGTRLCCSVRDALDARAVAKHLGIPHQTLELTERFRAHVIDYFVASYRDGLTPNPCVACNDHIKFGALLEQAEALGAATIATGHYARLSYDAALGRYQLRRGRDAPKDQSYVLFNLSQEQLAHACLPLGELSKDRVRERARELGFVTAEKRESQDVCFIRDRDTNGFLRRELGASEAPGPIEDRRGRRLGTHRGLLGYTIGQREGLGIATGAPLYVLELDQARNRLVVGSREELLALRLVAERVNWLSTPAPHGPLRAQVKIRSRHVPAAAWVRPLDDERVQVDFDEPQSALTPGQAVVFYEDDLVLGGGWIAKPVAAGQDGGVRAGHAAA